jgi:formate hydrogenlyase subunit 4
MVSHLYITAFYVLCALLAPPLTLGTIRKVKARLQSRIGAPLWQPILDILKLLRKDETISKTASWVFRFAAAINCSFALYLVVATPWLQPKPEWGGLDIFTFLYLLAAMRLFTLLAAMDTGSAFGAFAASREATLSFLVEPASVLSLAALGIVSNSAQLNVIFSFHNGHPCHPGLWAISGTALLLASLVELSRMPIDDPTTHLELTMVHEAMLLEASGRNLMLFEYANILKLSVLFGLSAQCYLHLIPFPAESGWQVYAFASVVMLFAVAFTVGVFESVAVKLHWTKAPDFIAYAITLSVVGSILALGAGGI